MLSRRLWVAVSRRVIVKRRKRESTPFTAPVVVSVAMTMRVKMREVRKIGPDLNGHRLLLRVNPDIARALKEEERDVLKDLKHSIGKDVTIKSDVQLHHEQFDVMAV